VAALNAGAPEVVAHLHLDLPWLQTKLEALGDPRQEADAMLQPG